MRKVTDNLLALCASYEESGHCDPKVDVALEDPLYFVSGRFLTLKLKFWMFVPHGPCGAVAEHTRRPRTPGTSQKPRKQHRRTTTCAVFSTAAVCTKFSHLTTKTRTNPNPPPPPFLSIAAYDRDIAAFARARGAGRAAAARGALRALEREARVTSAN